MNLVKKLLTAALAAACLFSLTGCSLFSHSFDPKKTGIYIASDRSVTSAEFTSFDNSAFEKPRYVSSEFQTYAQDTVSAFNKEKAGLEFYSADDTKETLPAAIEKLEFEDETVKLILKFRGFQDYLDFYGTTDAVPVRSLVVGSVQDGISSGLSFESMKDADGNDASEEDIRANTDYTLVMISGDTEVQCEGKIVYCSAGVKLTDKYTAEVSGSGTEFIIFK